MPEEWTGAKSQRAWAESLFIICIIYLQYDSRNFLNADERQNLAAIARKQKGRSMTGLQG
jgi:hypothetical protein